MEIPSRAPFWLGCLLAYAALLSGCNSTVQDTGAGSTTSTGGGGGTPPPPTTARLTVTGSGTGAGMISSSPSGINCGQTCSATFNSGTAVTLAATPTGASTFAGWSGACSGTNSCSVTLSADTSVTATFNGPNLNSIQHIVFMLQENRSFDNYFGALRDYWAKNGYSDQSLDGLPQFNPVSGAAPLRGSVPSNPGCDPASPPPNDCIFDPAHAVSSYHLQTMCTENTNPSWNEAHVHWNYYDQVGKYPATMNGFVWTAGHDARNDGFFDTNGVRAMGYYDGGDLNYYYFMASNFATSDRWFSPVMSRTSINREYLIGATSQGRAYPNGTNPVDTPQITSKTIFEDLTNAGISWKIYINPTTSNCTAPYAASCMIYLSYLQFFTFAQTVVAKYPQNLATMTQYYDDLKNNTLPQVAMIESLPGDDEHGSTSDNSPANIQEGAQYASTIINSLMSSSSWNNSVFILTFDESGGLYDHVPPQPTVSPDGIAPMDLQPGDACTKVTGPTCDFVYTGYRVPLIVVSPFSKKHYVSHTVADYTAILKLIETRFKLPALNKRDDAQMDMTEFFDFSSPQWLAAPMPPAQNTSGACYLNHLP